MLVALVFLAATGCALTRAVAEVTHTTPDAKPVTSPPTATPSPLAKRSPLAAPGAHRVKVGSRSFVLLVPPHVAHPAPMMVMLGGIGWSGTFTMNSARVGSAAAAAGGLVAFPDPVRGVWNAGQCCWGATTDDVGFFHRIHDRVAKVFPLDPKRQVVAGFSNGGMMAYRAGCDDPLWSAIGVLGATLTERCTASHPFSITNVNGMEDTSVAWNGGYSPRGRYTTPPVWEMDQSFAQAFGCRAPATSKSGKDMVITYAGCRNGVTIRDIRRPGLHHHFPLKEADGYDFGPELWRLVLG
jgi:poly(3-hydroxybutyrate) depolymerase